MKFILMYDFLYEPGGLERLMTIHGGYLKRAGYDVELFYGDIKKELLKAEIYKEFRARDFGSLRKNSFFKVLLNLLGFNKLKNMIEKDDVILSYSFPINFTIRNFKNRKIFYMNHFPNYLYLPMKERVVWANNSFRKIALFASVFAGFLLRALDRKLVRKMDFLFVNSHFTKKRVAPIYKKKSMVSWPPVQHIFKPSFDEKIKEKFNIKNKFIYTSGRIIPDKKTDWLIKAFSKLKDKDVELVISGFIDEIYKECLDNLISSLGIKERVKFVGLVSIEDLVKLYSTADVYVFPAPKEDFGLTPVETLSCGSPVIAWNDGSGPTENIVDGENGFLVKPYNLNELAKKIDEALEKKWNRKSISKSVERASEKYIEKEFVDGVKTVI